MANIIPTRSLILSRCCLMQFRLIIDDNDAWAVTMPGARLHLQFRNIVLVWLERHATTFHMCEPVRPPVWECSTIASSRKCASALADGSTNAFAAPNRRPAPVSLFTRCLRTPLSGNRPDSTTLLPHRIPPITHSLPPATPSPIAQRKKC